jgi:hypothetical protein
MSWVRSNCPAPPIRKLIQNLVWATAYNTVAITPFPIDPRRMFRRTFAGAFAIPYPSSRLHGRGLPRLPGFIPRSPPKSAGVVTEIPR